MILCYSGVDLGILRESGGGGGGSGPEFFMGGRVQVRGNFHILTSKKKTSERGGGLNLYKYLCMYIYVYIICINIYTYIW